MIALAMALLLQGSQGGQPPPVRMGYEIRPETVTVGDPFRVVIRVRAPRGAEVEFPTAPDSGAKIEALDPRQLLPSADSTAVDVRAVYGLAAWDVGSQPLQLGDVVVRVDGRERRVPLGTLGIFVRSVLPEDSTLHVPKPERALFEFGRPWWHWLVAGLIAIGIIGLLYWLWHRRRRRAAAEADPFAIAEEEFERVERLGLVAAGERGRYVALMVEILREYLARRVDGANTSLTTTELLAALRSSSVVPSSRLALVLAEADLIKFARRAVSAERAIELGREARAIVGDTNAAAAAADEQAEREQQQRQQPQEQEAA